MVPRLRRPAGTSMSEHPVYYRDSWMRGEPRRGCFIYASLELTRNMGLTKFADQATLSSETRTLSILNDSREFLGSGDCNVFQTLHGVGLCFNASILLGNHEDHLIELEALCPMHGGNAYCF